MIRTAITSSSSRTAYQRPAIWDALYQALFFELEQSQSHITAMGLEQIAKVLLDQALPRLTSPKYDVLLDALGDDGGCRFSGRRYRQLTGFGRPRDRVFGWFSDHHCPDLKDAPPPVRRGRRIPAGKSFQL
jgi:hypothetical protein